MARELDTQTLAACAQSYAASFMQTERRHGKLLLAGPQFVVNDLYNLTYKDEFDFVLAEMREWLSARALKELDRMCENKFQARSEATFHELLRSKLAISPEGEHLSGQIGTVKVGSRLVGTRTIEVEAPESVTYRKKFGLGKEHRRTHVKTIPYYWPIYAGETEERLGGSDVPDTFPPGTPSLPLSALNTRISNEAALGACDYVVDRLDEGTGPAVIEGRTGAQPTDPDEAAGGTLLFTLTCSSPAFGAAADAAPGATATANSVTGDSSADATGTVGYCRAYAADTGPSIIDSHIDGEAGTSGADFNFNSVAISAGAQVDLTTWTVTQPES